jgi:hypothetical protein
MPLQIRIRKHTLLSVLLIVPSLLAALSTPEYTAAQTDGPAQCSQVLLMAEKSLSTSCNNLERDEICYGNSSVTVQYAGSSGEQPTFANVGDVAPVEAIQSITTAPLNLDRNEWGIAVLRVRSKDFAGTTAGQFVTLMLYGDAQVTDASTPTAAPMTIATDSIATTDALLSTLQPTTAAASEPSTCRSTVSSATYFRIAPKANGETVQRLTVDTSVTLSRRTADKLWLFGEADGVSGWLSARTVKTDCDLTSLPTADPAVPVVVPGLNALYFSTGINAQAACQDVPAGTIMLQSPSHQKVTFRANGIDFTVGSTVLFTAQANKSLTAIVLDGQLTAEVDGKKQTAFTGQMLTVPLGGQNGLDAAGPPSPPKRMQLEGKHLLAACSIAKAAGLQNPCARAVTGTARPRPTTLPTKVVPGGSTQASCPDPADQRYLLPCGPMCPAGQLRSNANTCVCPQNCGPGQTNIVVGGQCTCQRSAAPACGVAGSACTNHSQCCSNVCRTSPAGTTCR